jgi:hypothetical protein
MNIEEARKRLEEVIQEAKKHDPYDPYWKREVDKARLACAYAVLTGTKSTQTQ